MAPRKPKRTKVEVEAESVSVTKVVEQETASSNPEHDAESPNDEPECHTDDSDASDDGADEAAVSHHAPPYLPAHLLRTSSTFGPLSRPRLSVPFDELTKQQRLNIRKRKWNTQRKKLRKLQAEAQANGVIAAGKAARIKRNVVPKSDRVRKGRVAKNRKPERIELSGRQRILEQRKRRLKQDDQSKLAKRAKEARSRAKT